MHEYLTKMHPGYLERTEPPLARNYRALLAAVRLTLQRRSRKKH